jgi:glycogen debranching enzyme
VTKHSSPPEYGVSASPELLDTGTRALKHADTFLVCDRRGDVIVRGHGQLGLFHRGVRHLSRMRLEIENERMLLLSSTVREDNVLLAIEQMNPDFLARNGVEIEHGTIHLRRERLLWDGALHEELRLSSYAHERVDLDIVFELAADFVDLFEVRGTPRAGRGKYFEPEESDTEIRFSYLGLDDELRITRVRFDRPFESLGDGRYLFRLSLEPKHVVALGVSVSCEGHAQPQPRVFSFAEALSDAMNERRAGAHDECEVSTSNELFDEWLRRSMSDLRMMITRTAWGPYPYAGVPWYCTPFGRDGIITALESLWVHPSLAAGVLEFLAAHQARECDARADAEPGKILHEMRYGEMAALGEVPFGRYYGTVDATPLFVLLAGRYLRATNDLDRIRRLWPSIEAALEWIERYGDVDGDGFVEYARKTPQGLAHQGWKDSHDAVFHADGSDAEPPIALAEVQGYVYGAYQEAASIAEALGDRERAKVLRVRAVDVREKFDRAFWCEDMNAYAIALDGKKRPCRVLSSNAGHCLFSGIARPDRAVRLASRLLAPEMFCHWGVRTIATTAARHNPMSYHNGSVWPHDNALIAHGLASYGLKDEAIAILNGLFSVACNVEIHRLPELFCGFDQRAGEGRCSIRSRVRRRHGRRLPSSCSSARCSGSTWTRRRGASPSRARSCRAGWTRCASRICALERRASTSSCAGIPKTSR